jgi:hypothetical protein
MVMSWKFVKGDGELKFQHWKSSQKHGWGTKKYRLFDEKECLC